MSSKEERALNLEIHRMNRAHRDVTARNAALEYECAQLRMRLNSESAKLIANQDAFLQKCAAYKATEHKMVAKLQMEREEMIATMQKEQNETMSRLQQQIQQEALTQKYEIKKTMEAHYADINRKKTQELDAAKKILENELALEKKARIQREEELVAYFWARMEEVNALNSAKMQKWEEDKRIFQEEWQQRLDYEINQRNEIKPQLELEKNERARLEEVNSLNVAKMQKWEEDKRIFQEEWQQRLDKEINQRNKIEIQLELEKNERARAETQMNYYITLINEQKLQIEKEYNELVVVNEKRFEDRIKSIMLDLAKTISFSKISQTITANYAQTQFIYNLGVKGQRVLLYSHYSDRDEVESYNYLTLEHMKDRFDYIIVLTNCPNKWDLPNANYNKYHMLWYNFKSDFRNYAVFILQSAKELVHASQLCLMNDSFVIVDVSAYERCMQCLFKSDTVTINVNHDFAGITSSHEGIYHIQSYFMLFNTTSVIKAVVNYFKMQGVPTNHNESISVYELGMTQHLINQGFTPYAMISNAEMQHPLNTTYYKWSAVLQHAGIIKRQHILKKYPIRYAMTDYNIALVANKFSENKHFIHFLKYHGINVY